MVSYLGHPATTNSPSTQARLTNWAEERNVLLGQVESHMG